MPKITSVEPQKKNPRRFNIFLDGQFAFGADEDLVVDKRLVVGKLLDTSDVEKLLFEAEVGKLMEWMYGLFNIRQRSEREIRNYLKNLSFKRKLKDKDEISPLTIESLIERLKKKGMLSDEDFAKAWVESRRKIKQKGKMALKMELYQKGIDREIIDEVLSDQISVETEEQLAQEALEKKTRIWNKLSSQEFKKKAYGFLMRRGFEYSIVEEVVENFLKKR